MHSNGGHIGLGEFHHWWKKHEDEFNSLSRAAQPQTYFMHPPPVGAAKETAVRQRQTSLSS
jgi:hypothetical protein